jgi:hypothetical protein
MRSGRLEWHETEFSPRGALRAHSSRLRKNVWPRRPPSKKHFGSKRERGTQVVSLLYSLIETAKHHGLPKATCLRQAAGHVLRNPGSPLLPHALLR